MTSTSLILNLPATLAVERAREILAACKDVDEAKGIRDKSVAVAVYLRARNASREAQNDAAEITIRAERRMGELLAETQMSRGGRPKKTGAPKEPVSTLDDLGLTKKQSAQAQQLAALPPEEFDKRVQSIRAATEKLNAAVVLGKTVMQQSEGMQDRRTARWFFGALVAKFGAFALDAYAQPHNALCPKFLTKEQDGNVAPWEDQTFGNPEFEDMTLPLTQALRQAELGIRSCIVGPVGGSQEWYHQLAIQGTIFVPDCRINYDLPDGTPTKGANRDTIVMLFGKGWRNQEAKRGVFRVRQLEVKHLAPGVD